VWALTASLTGAVVHAASFTINTPGGQIVVDIGHVGPYGSLVSPAAPQPPEFRPPTIFSAPLPSGSGARALGFAGSFTAVADDATAASWNPAGLIQLERPEASAVLRASHEINRHDSADPDYTVGENAFSALNLNYASAVLPFRFLKRNFVFSANYQEAYDFTQEFTADALEGFSERHIETQTRTDTQTKVQKAEQDGTEIPGSTIDVTVTSHLTTRTTSYLDQVLSSDLLDAIEFEQAGLIDAMTPALAVEITPKLSFGTAVNFYHDNTLGGHAIRSRTRARYSGTTASLVDIEDRMVTTGTYEYKGVIRVPPSGSVPFPLEIPIEGKGEYPEFSDTAQHGSSSGLTFDGVYEEENEYERLWGVNATFGLLWTISRHLTLAADLDLPWTADAEQTRTVRNTITTYDASGTRVLDVTETESAETKDVTFTFPLYWAAGAVWRWSDRFYTTLDVSQTWWSDFAFEAEGGEKLNPLDGTPHGEHEVDDCWALRAGLEYLWVMKHTEIPFRAGGSWEQRPAVGDPDQYWGVSVGTGVSFGKDPGKLILDAAYLYTWGNDVLGSLVPDQPGLGTDVRKHQVFVSAIWHF
jgi:long-subunit fatty acid transport protein